MTREWRHTHQHPLSLLAEPPKPPLVVVVTGGREYRDREAVRSRLSAITAGRPSVTLYHGGCTLRGREGYQGADRLADEWAREHGLTPRVFEVTPGGWAQLGPSAGPRRNRAMLQAARVQAAADGAEIVCVAFPGGTGTKSCVDIARELGVSVVESKPTRVVNLRRESYDVYIGRPGRGQAGPWGNPIVLGEPCPECGEVHTRANPGRWEECYEAHLRRMLLDPPTLASFVALRGKVLGCFCKPAPCHGDVMLRVLASIP